MFGGSDRFGGGCLQGRFAGCHSRVVVSGWFRAVEDVAGRKVPPALTRGRESVLGAYADASSRLASVWGRQVASAVPGEQRGTLVDKANDRDATAGSTELVRPRAAAESRGVNCAITGGWRAVSAADQR